MNQPFNAKRGLAFAAFAFIVSWVFAQAAMCVYEMRDLTLSALSWTEIIDLFLRPIPSHPAFQVAFLMGVAVFFKAAAPKRASFAYLLLVLVGAWLVALFVFGQFVFPQTKQTSLWNPYRLYIGCTTFSVFVLMIWHRWGIAPSSRIQDTSTLDDYKQDGEVN